MSVRVLLVDDQEMIRMGFRMVLESRPGIDVVGEADDGDTALDLLGIDLTPRGPDEVPRPVQLD